MKETFQRYLSPIQDFWKRRTGKQRVGLIASLLFVLLVGISVAYFTSRTTLVPLYSNLSPSETGAIKESLDGRGIVSEIADGGTTIKVPSESVDTLKVELAAEGIPKSGSIDYSFFSQNAGLGMTDNEFNVLKVEAMQTELGDLIKGIEGVKDAKVMINLPEKGIFVRDETEQASASIVLNTSPGYNFKEEQIQALYHLVGKSVPNLPTDNIVIMNQYFEYFDLKNEENSSGASFASQNEVKLQVQRDVQRQVQNMLGTLIGHDKVIVSVTADIDFTQENREENLVQPVDEENMEGIAISAQRITETFTGNGEQAGGVPQAEDPADAGTTYLEGTNGNGDYEKVEETINNEVNRIRKEIVESPYKVRDLGIQVMVEPPNPEDPASLPQDRVDDITKILGTIVRTTIDKSTTGEALTDEAVQEKIAVSVQPFNGKIEFSDQPEASIPWWIYAAGGVLLAALLTVLFLFIHSRRKAVAEEAVIDEIPEPIYVPDVNRENDNEGTLRKKQLEKMAKEKPEDFAKLLRTWLTEE